MPLGPSNELFSARRPPTGNPLTGFGAPYSIALSGVAEGDFSGIPGMRFDPPSAPVYGRCGSRKCNMPGAGTDKTKRWVERPGPCVILVEPQLADNIGAAARAMANFGLARLRLVNPREGWPAERAYVVASGAHRVLDDVQVYDSVEAAIGDLHYVFATTARAHDQAKPVCRCRRGGADRRREGGRGRERRTDVRARAQRAGERRGRARRPDHHPAGESGVRLAQSRAGGGDRRL